MKKLIALFFTLTICTNVYALPSSVIPSGKAVGICIKTDGLLVVKTTDLTDEDGKKVNPAKQAGIKSGDRIVSADGNEIKSCEQLLKYVNLRKNDIVLTVKRNSSTKNTVITPVFSEGSYQLGIWVKDSAAGIGTVTYIDPESGNFGALGHGISDTETNTLLVCESGQLLDCSVLPATVGKRGKPGELNADFSSTVLADFHENTDCGLFGKVNTPTSLSSYAPVEVASFFEIREGPAVILADVDGKGVLEYSIEIKKATAGNLDGKNIVFKVSDEKLISKTGGIVCGMSGSPILQNGKIIGAVTHVFVNDPTKGYGICIENMLSKDK